MTGIGTKTPSHEVLGDFPFSNLIEKHGLRLEISGLEGVGTGGTRFGPFEGTHANFSVLNNEAGIQVLNGGDVCVNWYFKNYQEVEVEEDENQVTITGMDGTGRYSVTLFKKNQ